MTTIEEAITGASSTVLRLGAYVFLRWIPGHHLPPAIATAGAIYIPSFLYNYFTTSPYELLADEIEIDITQVETEDQPPALASTAAHSSNLASDEKPIGIEEEIEIHETIVLEEKSARSWRTLLAGIPSPTSRLLSWLTFLINLLLLAASADLLGRATVFHPSHDLSFARLGYLDTTEANLLVREPDVKQLPIFISYRRVDPPRGRDDAWKAGGTISSLDNTTDFTSAIKINLPNSPETTYQYTTSNNHTGFFTTPPRLGDVTKNGEFTFLSSSCIKPRFPYNPLDHPLAIPGFKHLANVIKSLPGGAQFMLFLGDFIYIDVPRRFGTSEEDYRREYRQVYASPDWLLVGQNLSWIHVIDDHEIANDWDRNTTGVYNAAFDPFHHYHTSVNPPPARQAGKYYTPRPGATYYEFTQGPATFFMMDTRSYRESALDTPADAVNKTMLGEEQLADLLSFLGKPPAVGVKWKFVISSIPFTKNWRVNGLDTWAGYLHERQIILESMWDVGLRGGVGVVILSGDRHEFAATAFPPPAGSRWPLSATVNEYSTSPLSQFYLPVPTYRQTDDDIVVKYIPRGNSKVGAITISNPSSEQSMLKFRLFVDGKEEWNNVILSPPIVPGAGRAKDSLWG